MSVGGQGEARGVVAQHTGDGFHVDAGLEGGGGEGVPQGMEGDVVQSGVPGWYIPPVRGEGNM